MVNLSPSPLWHGVMHMALIINAPPPIHQLTMAKLNACTIPYLVEHDLCSYLAMLLLRFGMNSASQQHT